MIYLDYSANTPADSRVLERFCEVERSCPGNANSRHQAGAAAKVAVDTTEVKNIWKANGAKPGMVLYEVYTTVYITPRDGLEEQLKQKK